MVTPSYLTYANQWGVPAISMPRLSAAVSVASKKIPTMLGNAPRGWTLAPNLMRDRSAQLVSLARKQLPVNATNFAAINKGAYHRELTRASVPSIYHGIPHAPTLLERLGQPRASDVARNAVQRGLVYHPSMYAYAR